MSVKNERRSGTDRRKRDVGPPNGWADRRKLAERRLPAAEETEISADEFARLFGVTGKVLDRV